MNNRRGIVTDVTKPVLDLQMTTGIRGGDQIRPRGCNVPQLPLQEASRCFRLRDVVDPRRAAAPGRLTALL